MIDQVRRRVPLEHRHIEMGARMVPFAGYNMPLQFAGIKEEHHAVRSSVGLFDVSHMGEVEFRGPDAVAAVDRLVTNDVSKLVDGQALYTAMCNEEGGIIDDLLVYRIREDFLLACVNASRRDDDVAHILAHVTGDVEVTDRSDDYAQLAIQGPKALALLQPIVNIDLSAIAYYHAQYGEVAGVHALISRTGYTGEDGFELYLATDDAEAVFDAILTAGEAFDLKMCGLGSRDTLRLEAKFSLYGNELALDVNPIEAGLGWVVKLNKASDFVGRDALQAIRAEGPSRMLRGLVLQERGMLRPSYPIFVNDTQVGALTSGGYAPALEQSIGLGYIATEHADAESVEVEIRGRRIRAAVTKKPFYKRAD